MRTNKVVFTENYDPCYGFAIIKKERIAYLIGMADDYLLHITDEVGRLIGTITKVDVTNYCSLI